MVKFILLDEKVYHTKIFYQSVHLQSVQMTALLMNSRCQIVATGSCVCFTSLGKGVFIMQVTDCDALGFYRKN